MKRHDGGKIRSSSHDVGDGVRGIGEDLAGDVAEEVVRMRGELGDLESVEEALSNGAEESVGEGVVEWLS